MADDLKTLFTGVYDALPADAKVVLNASPTDALREAILDVIVSKRKASMVETVNALTSGTVTDWTQLEAACDVADGETWRDCMTACDAAIKAKDADALVGNAVAAFFAAKKRFKV